MIEYVKNIAYACYSKEFYQRSQSHSFFERLLVLILTILLAMLLVVVFYSKNILFYKASISESLNTIVQEAKNIFPQDLEVRLQSHELTINHASPYFIKPSWLEEKDGYKYLLVYDEAGSFEDFNKYQTIVLVTKKFIAGKKDNGEVRMYQFSEMNFNENLYFDHAKYTELVDKLLIQITSNKFLILFFAMFIAIFMAGVIVLGIIMYQLLALFFYALLGLIIAKITNRELNYTECYLNAMYIFVPMTLLSWFMPNIFIFLLRVLVFGVLFYLFVKKESIILEK